MDAGEGLGDDAALAALRDVLAALGATTPRLVFKKTLKILDVDPNQARLLIKKRDEILNDASGAFTAFLSADEKDGLRDDDDSKPRSRRGVQVPAYDRHGRRFDTRLCMAQSRTAYRVFGIEWNRFVAANQLREAFAAAKEAGRMLEVEVWAFRSAELPPLVEHRVEIGQHPDGALGVAILIRN